MFKKHHVKEGPMGAAIGAAVVGSILSSAMAPSAPAAPPLAKTPTMPTMDSAAVAQSAKASVAAQMKRQGRASTILSDVSKTDSSQKLGG